MNKPIEQATVEEILREQKKAMQILLDAQSEIARQNQYLAGLEAELNKRDKPAE